MGNIIIYGGTFNPIHKGHIHFLRGASQILKSKKTIIVPSGGARYKTCLSITDQKTGWRCADWQ
jgi:cytidyltransferase-like protein